MSEGYNGWTNYETWLVNLWLDSSEGDQEMRREWAQMAVAETRGVKFARGAAIGLLVEYLQDWMGDLVAEQRLEGLMADMMDAAVASVNWDELARHYIDAVLEEVNDAEASA